MSTNLSLYHLPRCPFCLKVRRAAAELGVELNLIDISRDLDARRHLVQQRGRATVPVLSIPTETGEQLLPESNDIITFVRAHAAANHSTAA